MEEAIFPPSPSWFLPNIISTREDGSICYGSKNNVIILQSGEQKKLEMVLIQGAHNFRVTGVAFSPSNCSEPLQNTLVSGSEDCLVKLWNIDSLTAIMGHKCHAEQGDDLGKVISLDWSTANPRYIVSVAGNNSIVLWDVLSNTTIKFSFQKLGATVISCCPFNDKVVAVGRKTGEIYIISLIENGNIIYRLRGHDNKIQSLSWCPIPYNIFKRDEIVEEFLLASSCQNKEIYIWRVGSDGKCEDKFQVPTNPLSNRDGQNHGKIKNAFSYLALCWLEPYKLYASSNFGELIYYDFKSFVLSKPSHGPNGKGKPNKFSSLFIKVAHCYHSKGLYAIAGFPVKVKLMLNKSKSIESELQFPIINSNIELINECEAESSDFAWDVIIPESSKSMLWTAGQDSKLVACEMKSSKVDKLFNCHTLNGVVYCAAVSPHDPNKIAIGVGDGMIRLLNLTEPFGGIQVFWQKIKDRVMCLGWHPKKDGILAYGTSDGRVGLLDTMSNKLPSVFKPSHPQPIYNLSWGPEFSKKNSSSESDFDLYCVGNYILSLYQPSNLNAEPLNLSKIIPFPCKKQTDVCWKPDYSVMAVGNEDGSICLIEPFEFKIVHTLLAYKKLIQSIVWHPISTSVDTGLSPLNGYFTSGSTDNSCLIKVFDCQKVEEEIKVNLVATLKGHRGYIQSVSWSPHISGRLISNSGDGSVQIWDVISQCSLVNFVPIGMPVFSIWSPVNPDYIFTGCRNDILCIWETSGQTKMRSSNAKGKKLKKEKEPSICFSKELMVKDLESEPSLKSSSSCVLEMAESKTISKSSKESKMFCKIWKDESIKNCYNLLKNENRENAEQNFSLPFFRDEEVFKASLSVEEEIHKKASNWNEFAQLALWSGNLKEVLEEKIANGQLNDFLVSLAPSVSPKLWQEACLSYSTTLAEKKFYRKAASYLIVCHKIYEAIRLLLDARLFLEAFCIARSRLPKSDPIFNEITRKYGEWLFKNGSFLRACECYIVLEDYLEVAKICGKKDQPEYLNLAALAAKRSHSFDLEAVEAANALFKSLERNNFDFAKQVCDDHSNFKHLGLILFIYQTVHDLDNGESELKKDILSYVREFYETDNITFPDSLPKLYHRYELYKQKEQVYIIISEELSFAACAKDSEETATHLIKSLSTCSRYIPNKTGETHLLYKLCQWLSPEGFLSKESFFSVESNLSSSKLRSMRAFLGASIVRHLSENTDSEGKIMWFDFLVQLRENILDADSYKYFQNLIGIEVLEKRLLRNRFELSNTVLTNSKKSDPLPDSYKYCGDSPLVTNDDVTLCNELEIGVLEPINEVEAQDNSEGLSEEKELNEANLVDETRADENSESVDRTIEEKCASSECEKTNLEEKLSKDLDSLKKLKTEIEQFEADRVSSPNPVPVYFMLKKLCEGAPENQSANLLLNHLNSVWEALN